MDIGWPEILIIALVILVLFGSKKLPDAARSLGRSMRILKTEVKGMHDDDAESTGQTTAQQVAQPTAAQPTPALPPAAAAAPVPPSTAAAQPAAQPGDQPESR